MAGQRASAQSELQFKGELNLPWVVSLAADHPEGRVAESSGGNSELDMIGDVKELGAELQVEAFAFAKWIILEKTEIEIVQAMGSRVGESAGAGTVRERGRLAGKRFFSFLRGAGRFCFARFWLLVVSGFARFAGVDRHVAVFLCEILAGDALDVGRGHSLMFGGGQVDFVPVAQAIIEDQLHEDGHVGREPAIFVGGEIIFDLLQFLRRDWFVFEFFDFGVEALFDFLRGVSFLNFARDIEEAGPSAVIWIGGNIGRNL